MQKAGQSKACMRTPGAVYFGESKYEGELVRNQIEKHTRAMSERKLLKDFELERNKNRAAFWEENRT